MIFKILVYGLRSNKNTDEHKLETDVNSSYIHLTNRCNLFRFSQKLEDVQGLIQQACPGFAMMGIFSLTRARIVDVSAHMVDLLIHALLIGKI